ncbi:MAG: TonB-dependent receptor [Acidobacteria bacterium]|nr:TonB-dependent receptor [Acidobacteriota bacterium]
MHSTRYRKQVGAFLGALLLLSGMGAAVPAAAQQGGADADDPDAPPRRFEEVVVTATLEDERVTDVPVTMQTFDREAIEESGAMTVTEFLSERGVAFFSTWTPGQTSINIRGGASDGQGRDFRSQVVVLINGRRAGTANISKLGLHNVERIEVLRGPGGLVYGSQALGGVINLITKDGLRNPGAHVRVGGGSWGLVETVAQYGASAGRWDYFVSAHGGRRGDYEAGAGAVESPMRNTAYQQGGGMVALGYTPNAFQRVTFTARTDGMYDTGFRGSSWDWDNDENRTNRSFDLNYSGESSSGRANWEVQTSYFRDLDDFRWGAEIFGSGRPGVDLDHNRRNQTGFFVRGLTNVELGGANSIQVGVDQQWWQLRSTRMREPLPGRTAAQVGPFDNNSDSRNFGVFFEDVQRVLDDRLILRGGVRFDGGRHQIRETPNRPNLVERAANYDAVTYRVGATAKPVEELAVRFNVQTGYRAPNATELAIDYQTVLGNLIIGNPDLEPEQATSYEVGIAYENARMWFDLALFRNDITNRIQAVGDTRNAAVRIYQNRAESELVGLELQSNFVLARTGDATSVNLGINAAHHFRMRDLDAAARELSTDRIIRVYETQGSVLLGVHNPAWMVQVAGTYYGPVWYDTEERLLIPFAEPERGTIHRKGPFTTWNLRGRYEVGEGLWLTGAVRNLLNKNDHPLFIAINREPLFANTALSNGGLGNSMPGRAFIVGFEWRT